MGSRIWNDMIISKEPLPHTTDIIVSSLLLSPMSQCVFLSKETCSGSMSMLEEPILYGALTYGGLEAGSVRSTLLDSISVESSVLHAEQHPASIGLDRLSESTSDGKHDSDPGRSPGPGGRLETGCVCAPLRFWCTGAGAAV
ncbi:hypothetical protein EYF80_007829 [Liparis tanakae]|uniref:Uncharacterized protein n=1 Tax=Liparis tanakae TaxID=230148 RepID=A0A4Z2IVR4_9TELE|nr:hypothetical protein EYF80_007829 [Liparis tanakae]